MIESTSSITLTLGANHLERIIPDADDLIQQYRNDTGSNYLNYRTITPPDKVVPEYLAVTLLVNSQVGWRAFRSLQEYGEEIELAHLPWKSLEQTSAEEREQVAVVIAKIAQFPGFAASVKTSVITCF